MTLHKKKKPPVQRKLLQRSIEITGVLSKAPIQIDDSEYTIGCAIQTSRTRYIGCRLKGLEAATIQRIKMGTSLIVKGTEAVRDNGSGKPGLLVSSLGRAKP